MVKINPPSPLAAAVFGGCALVWLVIAFVPAPVTSGDWAAWIQGVGTIVAVALGTWTRPPAVVSERRKDERGADARAARLDQVVSWLRRATADLELAIWDADFKRLRDGIGQIRGGPARATLDLMLREPRSAWPDAGLQGRAFEVQKAVVALGQLMPEPEADASGDLSAWWVALQATVIRLRTATDNMRGGAEDS